MYRPRPRPRPRPLSSFHIHARIIGSLYRGSDGKIEDCEQSTFHPPRGPANKGCLSSAGQIYSFRFIISSVP